MRRSRIHTRVGRRLAQLKARRRTAERRLATLMLAAVLACGSRGVAADPAPEPSALARFLRQETLTGEWGGRRAALVQRGLSFEAHYTVDILANTRGGIRRRTETLGNVDLLLTFDVETAWGWNGAQVFLYGLGNHGGNPSENVGDTQGVSNIETVDTWKLYEAWFEQRWAGDEWSLLAGLYDLNSEFDVLPTAGLFLNSSFGIGPDFALSGVNGPSIFPSTSLAVRLAFKPRDTLYARAAVLDGIPGDPDDPRGTQIVLDRSDGLLVAAELGLVYEPHVDAPLGHTGRLQQEPIPTDERTLQRARRGKYALGIWSYSTDFDDLVRVDANGRPRRHRGTYGVYALAEQRVFFEAQDPTQGLGAFVRAGIADKEVNVVDAYLGGGLVYQGLLPGRPRDQAGLGLAAARFGEAFRSAAQIAGAPADRWELTLELSYRASVTPWLTVQPDAQFVFNPGGDPTVHDAASFGARAIVAF